jgi:hypothetical protein
LQQVHKSLVHLLCFAVIMDRSRPLRASVVRDAFAARPLEWLLWEEGYGHGDAFLDYPPQPIPKKPLPLYEYADFDLSRLAPGDLLLEPTRFPLHDVVAQRRKRVPVGYTNLEARLMAFWENFFEFCARDTVQLTPDLQRSLLPGCEQYANIELRLNGSADVRHVDDGGGSRGEPPLPGSVAFFLRTDQIWPGGPGLFAAFGMDAEYTAAWTWMLCHELRDLTRRRGFTMVAIEAPPPRPARGWYSDLANDYKAQILLDHPFDDERQAA